MEYEERWYEVGIREVNTEAPDFGKVPAERRDMVRQRWFDANVGEAKRWRLWGPQIPRYMARDDLRVVVIRRAVDRKRPVKTGEERG